MIVRPIRSTGPLTPVDDASSARLGGRLMSSHAVARRIVAVASGAALLVGCTAPSAAPSASPPADSALAGAVDQTVQEAMRARPLRAVIVRVTVDGKEVITKAYGESMTGVPATVDRHF